MEKNEKDGRGKLGEKRGRKTRRNGDEYEEEEGKGE